MVYNMTVLTVFMAEERQLKALTVAASQVVALVVQLTSASIGPKSILPFNVTEHKASGNFTDATSLAAICVITSLDVSFINSAFLPTDACVKNAASTIVTDRITFFILLFLIGFLNRPGVSRQATFVFCCSVKVESLQKPKK